MAHPIPIPPPILGLTGGIAAGKSHVASAFKAAGCLVIDSDALVSDAYHDPAILAEVFTLLGPDALDAQGQINRAAVAAKVFSDAGLRRGLEAILHPRVEAARHKLIEAARQAAPPPVAIVLDSPLLMETGLHLTCQHIVYVDTPVEVRLARAAARGWTAEQYQQRSALQWEVDRKRAASNATIDGCLTGQALQAAVEQLLGSIAAGETLRGPLGR